MSRPSLAVLGAYDGAVTLEQAWDELPRRATPPGWYVRTPVFHVERGQWALYAFDQTERVKAGKRSREWTAQHPTQVGLVREMARCLREISEGRVPR